MIEFKKVEQTNPKDKKDKEKIKREKKLIQDIEKMGLEFRGQFKIIKDGNDDGDIDAVFYDSRNKIYLFFEFKTKSKNARQLEHLEEATTGDNKYKKPLMKALNIKNKNTRRVFICIRVGEESPKHRRRKNFIYKEDWEYLKMICKVLGELSYIHFYEFLNINISLDGPKCLYAKKIRVKVLSRKVDAYICNVSLNDLFQSAFVHRKRNSSGSIEGFQRFLKNKKIKEISNMVMGNELHYGGFMTLNSREKIIESERFEDEIDYPHRLMSVSVIDGQHRLYGYTLAASKNNRLWKKEVPIIMFNNLKEEEEIELFIKLNSTQSSVDPNLIYYHDKDNEVAQFFVSLDQGKKYKDKNWFKNRINTGNQPRGKKSGSPYTLNTLVSIVSKYTYFNQGNETPVKSFKKIYETIIKIFPKPEDGDFLYSDNGIRILFKFIDHYDKERGKSISKAKLEKVSDLLEDSEFTELLKGLYGEGGALQASRIILEEIESN